MLQIFKQFLSFLRRFLTVSMIIEYSFKNIDKTKRVIIVAAWINQRVIRNL